MDMENEEEIRFDSISTGLGKRHLDYVVGTGTMWRAMDAIRARYGVCWTPGWEGWRIGGLKKPSSLYNIPSSPDHDAQVIVSLL